VQLKRECRDTVPSMALTPKHELFAREYLKDLNAVQAALRAGYSPGYAAGASKELLGHPEVAAYVAERFAERTKQLQIDANEVLNEIRDIALADPADGYTEHGAFHRSIHDLPRGLRRTIASIKTKDYFEGEGADRRHIGEIVEVKFHDKVRTLDMLMRHLSLYRDTLQLEGLDDMAERIVAARKRTGA